VATTLKGIKFPFQLGTTGFPAMSEGNVVVSDQVRVLFTTGKGERVMRPTLGVEALEMIFGDISPITKARIAADAVRAFRDWVLLAVVRAVDVYEGTTENDDTTLYADIEYSIAGQIESQQVPMATANQG
jgi:phage baseplate assembly protein W